MSNQGHFEIVPEFSLFTLFALFSEVVSFDVFSTNNVCVGFCLNNYFYFFFDWKNKVCCNYFMSIFFNFSLLKSLLYECVLVLSIYTQFLFFNQQ